MGNKRNMNRREFMLKSIVGSGVILSVGLAGCGPTRRFLAETANEIDFDYNNDFEPIAWFEITVDNTIFLHSPKVEMGQGVFTGLAQLAAEELEIEMNQIKVVHASSKYRPLDPRATGGSDSISGNWEPLRALGAKMREMLRTSAGELMDIHPDEIHPTGKGAFREPNGNEMTYGEIVKNTTEWKVPKKVELKARSDFKIIGKPIPRVDLVPKVMGDPIFGIDATFPGMLYGSVVRSSMVASSFSGADTEEAEKMPGVVKIVVEADFVGVVAESHIEAEQAKAAINAKWSQEKTWQQADVEEMIRVGKGKPFVIQKEGKSDKVLEEEGTCSAEYTSPIGAHAQLEPNGAVASVEDDKVQIKMSTQVAKTTRKEVADRLGFKEEQVEVQTTFLGGGFGRRLHTPNAMHAAVLSRAVGKPVHVFFNRREEFQNDTFRPPTHHVLKGKLDKSGMLQALEHNVSSGDVAFGSPLVPGFAEPVLGADFGAWRGGMIQYKAIPNYKTISWRVKLPFATSWWRSLGLLANTFAIESFMDEMAEKAGKDPVQFRLEQIADDERGIRLRGVIEAAAKKAGWGKEMPAGRAMGFAASTDANTPVAQVVEISVEAEVIKIHKVTCAIDPGIVINPDSVRAQCEGAIIMGISASMFEKMVLKDGAIVPTNYGAYSMARMKHAPREIDVVLLEGGTRPSGVGEPPLGPIGAAIGNAVFRLTGKRLRNLPLTLDS